MIDLSFLSLDALHAANIAYSTDELLPEEKQYYAESLLIQGEMHLLRGDCARGLELFDSAIKLEPNSAKLFYMQGLSLFEYGSEVGHEKALLLASKKFKIATQLSPEYFEVWQAWGNTLSLLGQTYREHHYFQEAKEKFRKAVFLSDKQPSDTLADLHWDYGVVFKHLAHYSEEALDLHLALDAFQKACTYQEHLPETFWNDYGTVTLQLAERITDVRLFVKAIHCFKHAITLDSSFYEGWHSLASALQQLYSHTHDEDHFTQANDCFLAATQLRPNDYALWLKWATFLCDSARRNQDTKRLRACVEKCQRAYACDPEQPMISAIWAEALALLGDLTERLDLIYDAQNKIAQAFDLSSDLPDVYYSYGMCLRAFAHYFDDLDYYYQAIEKFQEGLSIDRSHHRLWHAIATTYALLAEIEGESDSLEKSLRFYTKALDLHTSSFYIFDYATALAQFGAMNHEQKELEEAVVQFERALNIQRNAIYLHPDWLFHYACTLDLLGDHYEEESYYLRAIEILSHVLMIDPDFQAVHHRLALCFSHLGELLEEKEHFGRAIHHYRLATKHDEENDQVLLDWALTLINLAEHTHDDNESSQHFRDAEAKLIVTAKLGNLQAYYHLSCLYSLLEQYDKAIHFLEKGDAFNALPHLDEILQDEWLDGLRSTPAFCAFLSHLESRPNSSSR
jgi:tetratricopeptide (TPR) repeat protein